jgi:outer membrane receptor protein involved in Fe transport
MRCEFLFCLVCSSGLAYAAKQPDHAGEHGHAHEMEEIVVWGRAETQKGKARSASEGLVGYADFSTRPLQRVGELVEVVPGMVATQHSGEGKANQYYLRGMNLDHGTDFSVYFEGMPVNLRAHAHGQGYLDLNFLIPEVISTVAYQKGPYFAERGDFSTAGSSRISVYDQIHPFVEVTAGSDDYRRLVTAGSTELAKGNLLLATEVLRNDGPWVEAANVDKRNLMGKYSAHDGAVSRHVLFSYYENDWNSTDQVPKRLVDAGGIDRFGAIDPTIGGSSRRLSLIGNVQANDWHVGGYVSDYSLNLFGNFTYFLENPTEGDQHEQVDRRTIFGGHAQRLFTVAENWAVRVGGDLRYDDIQRLDLYQTTGRERRVVTRQDQVAWASLGAFAELEVRPIDDLRITAGLRGDYYDFEVDSVIAANAGSDDEINFLPSLSVAYSVNDYVELYVNWGQGFHSNDVRGVTIAIDPASGEAADSVDLFVEQEGAEIGVRVEGWRGLVTTLTYFWLASDSDLLFVGDSGSTEPGEGSKRTGLELNTFWHLNHQWTADVLASVVDSEFTGVPSNANQIPNAHGEVVGAGLTYVGERLEASLRLRHFGDAPLIEDGSVEHDETSLINARLAYDFGQWVLSAEVINVFDAEDDDIAYFFESALQGQGGVEDVHFHPVDPLSVRFSVRWEL